MHSLFVTCHVLLLATTALHGACGADGQGQQQSLKDAGAPSPLRSTGPPRFQNYHDGVWAAPHVPAWRVGQARVFEPSAGHRVAVMPLPNQRHFHALRQIASDCDAGWEPLLSYNDEDIPTFACKPTPSRAEADRRDFYTDNTTRQLLHDVFNVTAGPGRETCVDRREATSWWEMLTGKSSARQWITGLNDRMLKDVWHSDGCFYDPRPGGTEMITALSYPHLAWRDEWGGQLEISAATCLRPTNTASKWYSKAVLRVTPSPDVLVIFSSYLVHRSTFPSEQAPRTHGPKPLAHHDANPAADGVAAWRFTSVMQVMCLNGQFFGPYEYSIGPISWRFRGGEYVIPVTLSLSLVFLLVAQWRESSRLAASLVKTSKSG